MAACNYYEMEVIAAISPPVQGSGRAWFWCELYLVCLGWDEVCPPQIVFVDFFFFLSLKRKIITALTEFHNCHWCYRCQSLEACYILTF